MAQITRTNVAKHSDDISAATEQSELPPLEPWQQLLSNRLDEIVSSNIEFEELTTENTQTIKAEQSLDKSTKQSPLFFHSYPYASEDSGITLLKGSSAHVFDSICTYTKDQSDAPSLGNSPSVHSDDDDDDDDDSSDDKLSSMIKTTGVIVEFTGSSFKAQS